MSIIKSVKKPCIFVHQCNILVDYDNGSDYLKSHPDECNRSRHQVFLALMVENTRMKQGHPGLVMNSLSLGTLWQLHPQEAPLQSSKAFVSCFEFSDYDRAPVRWKCHGSSRTGP